MTKRCGKCKEEKSLCQFWKDSAAQDELFYWCKTCAGEYDKEYRKENTERIKEKQKEYNEKNSEHIKEQMSAYNKEYYKVRGKEAHYKKKYGLKPGEYLKMHTEQGGVCAGCGLPETATQHGKVRDLCVDHIEGTKTVRGLLCSDCNTGIGKLKHDPDRLENLARYLRRHNQ